MEVLERPAVLDELGRKPVEQFRMTGPESHRSEIGGGRDEAASKVVVPDPVHDDAGGERIRRIDDPVREGDAALGLGGIGGEGESP